VNPFFVVVLVLWAISAIGLVVFVLMHSGRGAGLSDMFGGSFDSGVGTGVLEKNLDRLTIICACVFIATLVLMMFIWPTSGV
jgi:preprotein translocase subunit SecG